MSQGGKGRQKALALAAGAVLLVTAAAAISRWVARPVLPVLEPLTLQSTALLRAVPAQASLQYVVRSGDTLESIFRGLQLDLADLARLRHSVGTRSRIDQLRRGETLTLLHADGILHGLERSLTLTEKLQVRRNTDGFAAEIVPRKLEYAIVTARGTIDSSLYEAADAAGLQDATVLKLAELFGWDIDFILDLRKGDRFELCYERLSEGGQYLQDGEILAARFVNDGREYRTVRYVSPEGKVGYYTPEGRSMEKEFLRAPLEFRRVSSRFSTGRYHPLLNRVRAHHGIDYAAAAGTPVRAAGAGRVRFRGARGGYGNVVELEHGGGIVTVYGHLSRFAEKLSAGGQVGQGEVIGFVGATGLATGPHLHYEYRVNGQHVDPQRVRLPDSRPVDALLLADFARQTRPLFALLGGAAPLPAVAQAMPGAR